uniref:Uncharacterized protein n=1 Tax=Cryptomonas curvata TaxID=233186 RepID=A0A7S0QCL3_9CRYP
MVEHLEQKSKPQLSQRQRHLIQVDRLQCEHRTVDLGSRVKQLSQITRSCGTCCAFMRTWNASTSSCTSAISMFSVADWVIESFLAGEKSNRAINRGLIRSRSAASYDVGMSQMPSYPPLESSQPESRNLLIPLTDCTDLLNGVAKT